MCARAPHKRRFFFRLALSLPSARRLKKWRGMMNLEFVVEDQKEEVGRVFLSGWEAVVFELADEEIEAGSGSGPGSGRGALDGV